nr:AlkA N-terminal domain-containing protein [Nesterenkonia alba]
MNQDVGFAERYRAVRARDARFDGQFFFAVSSTGIYCRPSCPARTPKPEHLTFYTTSAAAHEAGYRACKRCLPEAVPGTPEWNLRQDLAGRAMRLIREGAMNRGGVQALSDQLGYSPRHIHRSLSAELGAGPLALARAHRAQTARNLLTSTDLSVSDIAFAAGFRSLRQFNDTMREVFDATPGEIRSRSTSGPKGHPPDHPEAPHPGKGQAPIVLSLDLPVREPFDAYEVFGFLAERALPGVEFAQLAEDRLVYARTLPLPSGPGAMEVTADGESVRWRLSLRCELTSLADVPNVVATVRRLLDLDADPGAVDAALSEDPALAPLAERTPGIRLPGAADPEEYVTRAIVGQQISVAAARTQLSRLVSQLGTPYESAFTGLTTVFPSPERILHGVPDPGDPAERPLDPQRPLRLTARSIRTVRRAAEALVNRELQVHAGIEPETLRSQLTALPGIGEWTAAYLSLRLLNHPDTWMTGDVALVAGGRDLGLIDDETPTPAAHRKLAKHAEAWSPWRSYAAMHLWKAAVLSKGHQT